MPVVKETRAEMVARIKSGRNRHGQVNGQQRTPQKPVKPLRIGQQLKSNIRKQFGMSCTKCFAAVVSQLDKMTVSEVRSKSGDFAKALYENAKESRNARNVLEWADYKQYGFSRYEQLVLEACGEFDPTQQYLLPSKEDCVDADIVIDSQFHGFGDAMLFAWVAEGAKKQGIKLAHFAKDDPSKPVAQLLKCFGQCLTSRPSAEMLNINTAYFMEKDQHGKISALYNRAKWLEINEVVRPSVVEFPRAVHEWADKTAHQDMVLLFPQATRSLRVWSMPYWIDLSERLKQRGVNPVMCMWGANSKAIKKYIDTELHIDLAWSQTIALMQKAKCVFGNNSGCVHVSGTLDVPTFVLSGLTTRESIEGIPSMFQVAVDKSECPCVECYYARPPMTQACVDIGCKALQMLTPIKVLEHFDRYFDA